MTKTTEEVRQLLARGVEALERNATASEELIRLATDERDSGDALVAPPLCPHCGRFNPDIRSGGQEGSGAMSSYVLVATCGSCQGVFYAMAQGWLCFSSPDEAQDEIRRRNAT